MFPYKIPKLAWGSLREGSAAAGSRGQGGGGGGAGRVQQKQRQAYARKPDLPYVPKTLVLFLH